MVSFAKLLRIRQGIGKKYKNIGLEKFLLSIPQIIKQMFQAFQKFNEKKV
jgi:hypothetical protein